ncbi:MAG TPA: M1 family aminopeptidase [Pyrinomonadaceae bacterium]|nr:M1 family aminopeptidase [Pyrinomonadaceae bacterium]
MNQQVNIRLLLFVMVFVAVQNLNAQTPETKPAPRHSYKIDLKLDFDKLAYTGTERVTWVNRGEKPTSVLYFHLYPNLRTGEPINSNNSIETDTDEPQLDIVEARSGVDDLLLVTSFDDQGTTLRITLREQVAPGSTTEVVIKFKGTVPEIDRDETSLTTHVVKQVSAALRSDREMRRPRDINFHCRGVMLLGAGYPVLAVHEGDDWRRKLEPSVGDFVFNETADYEVTVSAPSGVEVFTSGTETGKSDKNGQVFAAQALRDFAILAGRGLRSEHTEVQGITVRSIYLAEHERVGKRALQVAANAVRVFTSTFGELPFKSVSIAEAPLVAGLGSCEFSGFNVIASAFYVDFDSPSMRNLPQIILEQRQSVEESLEWAVAHLVAHQWWGAAVGNDPAREPILDEALSCWSSLLYYESTYGAEKAEAVLDDQVRGVYRLYRTFGGDDMDANRPSRDYRNTFQYAAIVTAKGALMFVDLQRSLGDEKIFAALRNYYQANLYEIAQMEDLRISLVAEAPVEQRRMIGRTMTRWLTAKRGDEDIAPPDAELAATLGIPSKQAPPKSGDKNAFGALAKVGKFFWQQMTRIR